MSQCSSMWLAANELEPHTKVFLDLCDTMAKIYCDQLAVARFDIRQHFTTPEMKAPIVALLQMSIKLKEKFSDEGLKKIYVETLANEYIATAVEKLYGPTR